MRRRSRHSICTSRSDWTACRPTLHPPSLEVRPDRPRHHECLGGLRRRPEPSDRDAARAGDTTAIRWLPDEKFRDRLIEEVRRFFPFEPADVDREHTLAMKHIDAPLFMNEVGSNSKRVEPTGRRDRYHGPLHHRRSHRHSGRSGLHGGGRVQRLLAAQAICKGLGIEGPAPKELQGVSVGQKRFLKVARYPLGWAALPLRLTEPYYRQRLNQQRRPYMTADVDGNERRTFGRT